MSLRESASIRYQTYNGWGLKVPSRQKEKNENGDEIKETTAELEPLTVSIKEAQRLTSIGHDYIFQLLKSGKLVSVKQGRRRLINYQSLKKLAGVI